MLSWFFKLSDFLFWAYFNLLVLCALSVVCMMNICIPHAYIDGCKLKGGYQEQNLGPVQEQQVFFLNFTVSVTSLLQTQVGFCAGTFAIWGQVVGGIYLSTNPFHSCKRSVCTAQIVLGYSRDPARQV